MCVHFSHGSKVSTDGWDFQIMRVVALCEKCVFTSFVYQMKSQGKATNFKLDLEDLFGLVGNQWNRWSRTSRENGYTKVSRKVFQNKTYSALNMTGNSVASLWQVLQKLPNAFNTRPQLLLTVTIDGEGCVSSGDLVVADLAVLWGAVLISSLHLQDIVINLALCHCCLILGLPKHWGKLIDIVDLNVHHCPVNSRGEQ